jgi:hypothetical protein
LFHAVSFRDGANYLAVGDILGNVIIIKPTPREFFFKFFDRVLEGSSTIIQGNQRDSHNPGQRAKETVLTNQA